MAHRIVVHSPTSSQTSLAARQPLRLALVEDDRTTRQELVNLLQRHKRIAVSASFSNAEAALAEIPGKPPDLVLMDLHLPKLSGVECIRQLKAAVPQLKIVVLTKYDDDTHLFPALMAGANGYLLKEFSGVDLESKILEASSGGAPLSGEIAVRMLQYFQQLGSKQASLASLSPRERETLEWLAKGYGYKEIAGKFNISPETLNGYIKSAYKKLHVHSALEAVRLLQPG